MQLRSKKALSLEGPGASRTWKPIKIPTKAEIFDVLSFCPFFGPKTLLLRTHNFRAASLLAYSVQWPTFFTV